MNYEDLQAVSVDRIAPALESIAASLAIIASDITERKEREQLLAEFRRLQASVSLAKAKYNAAIGHLDWHLERNVDDDEIALDRASVKSSSVAMRAASDAFDAFVAANPGIAEMAGDA